MPLTTNDFADVARRHIDRFQRMERQMATQSLNADGDLAKFVIGLHSGQPSGAGRTSALRAADYPFARRHGEALWATPPVGSITGKLIASLQFPLVVKGGKYTVTAKSVGVDYAQFVYSLNGTKYMLPRDVLDQANAYAEFRVIQLGRDLMNFQLRLL